MGGKSSTTYIPYQRAADNSAQLATMNQMFQQQQIYQDEQRRNLEKQYQFKADEAAAENLRETQIRQAEADAEKEERERRAKKGKRDLLWNTYVGLADEDEEDDFLLLGDN